MGGGCLGASHPPTDPLMTMMIFSESFPAPSAVGGPLSAISGPPHPGGGGPQPKIKQASHSEKISQSGGEPVTHRKSVSQSVSLREDGNESLSKKIQTSRSLKSVAFQTRRWGSGTPNAGGMPDMYGGCAAHGPTSGNLPHPVNLSTTHWHVLDRGGGAEVLL